MKRFHIAIIGGGPTGLMSALFLAQKGHRVSLFEKESWPVDKVCGEGIMPRGVELLRDLNLLDEAFLQGRKFKGIHYFDANKSMAKAPFLSGTGLGIRRCSLSSMLYYKALKEEGIYLHPQHEFSALEEREDGLYLSFTSRDDILGPFDYLLACDGLHSKVKSFLNMKADPPIGRKRVGARVHYKIRPWDDHVQVWWKRGLEAYVTPSSENMVEIAFIWEPKIYKLKGRDHLSSLLCEFPEIENKVRSAQLLSPFKSIGPLAQRAKDIRKGRVFFLGDSYYFLDGITGEGLTLSFEQAKAWANCLGDVGFNENLYRKKVNKLLRSYKLMTKLALFFTTKPFIRRASFLVLKLFPSLFSCLLEFNMGKWPKKVRKKALEETSKAHAA